MTRQKIAELRKRAFEYLCLKIERIENDTRIDAEQLWAIEALAHFHQTLVYETHAGEESETNKDLLAGIEEAAQSLRNGLFATEMMPMACGAALGVLDELLRKEAMG